jgi:hypothetical protein
MSSPKVRSDEDLKAAAVEVTYELVTMAEEVVMLMNSDPERIEQTAAFEATLGHMRNLVQFCNLVPKPRDISPADFGSPCRGEGTKRLYGDLSAHLSHLSWARVDKPPEEFDVLTAAWDLYRLFRQFVASLSTNRQPWFEDAVRTTGEHLAVANALGFNGRPRGYSTSPTTVRLSGGT